MIMKKMVKKCFFVLMAVAMSTMVFSSCSSDDDEKKEVGSLQPKLEGKWTLLKYNGAKITWDEYMVISGKSMTWNSRQKGENSTYSITFTSDSTFIAKCVYASDEDLNGADWNFTVTMCTSDSLKTKDGGGNTRVYARE